MFVEGIYLYSRVSRNVFSSAPTPFYLYYTLGWGKFQAMAWQLTSNHECCGQILIVTIASKHSIYIYVDDFRLYSLFFIFMFLQKIIKSTDTSDIIVLKPSSILHILLHYSPRCTRYTTPHSTSNNQYLYWTLSFSSHVYFSVPAGSDHLLGHGNDDDWIGRGVLGWLQRLLHHLHHRHPHDPGPHSNKPKKPGFL